MYQHKDGLVTLAGTPNLDRGVANPESDCPACSGNITERDDLSGYGDCDECAALVTTRLLVGTAAAYSIVKSEWSRDPGANERARYFDISYIQASSNRIRRRHGWYDPETGLIAQSG